MTLSFTWLQLVGFTFSIHLICCRAVVQATTDDFLRGGQSASSFMSSSDTTAAAATACNYNNGEPPKLILLDVDNTLYRESDLLRMDPEMKNRGGSAPPQPQKSVGGGGGGGIESQLRQRIYNFCASRCNLTVQEANRLHRHYGSTIEGIRQTLWSTSSNNIHERRRESGVNTTTTAPASYFSSSTTTTTNTKQQQQQQFVLDQMRDFYQSVYNDIDVSGLVALFSSSSSSFAETTATSAYSFSATGYSHDGGSMSTTGSTRAAVHNHNALAIQILHDIIHSRQRSQSDNAAGSVSRPLRFGIASNSPAQHVYRILHAIGLASIIPHLEVILTPDHDFVQQQTKQPNQNDEVSSSLSFFDDKNKAVLYPTKAQPKHFFKPVLSKYKAEDICLIDDSFVICSAVQSQTNMQVIPVATEEKPTSSKQNQQPQGLPRPRPLLEAIVLAMGWLDPHFVFSDANYLESKNVIDRASIHEPTWQMLLDQIALVVKKRTRPEPLVIVDLGAGLLSMLESLLRGKPNESLENMDEPVKPKKLLSLTEVLARDAEFQNKLDGIVYYAYETNHALAEKCVEKLILLGFEPFQEDSELSSSGTSIKERVFYKSEDSSLPYVEVRLRFWDFRQRFTNPSSATPTATPTPHVVLGCCFADLWHPRELVQCLMQHFVLRAPPLQSACSSSDDGVLVYFPITFAGTTQFLPPQPFGRPRLPANNKDFIVPSDAKAFHLYAKALCEHHGHSVDVERLVEEMKNYGAELLSKGPSDWVISPSSNNVGVGAGSDGNDSTRELSYLWQAMLYFFGMTAAPSIHKAGYDAHGWLRRARERKPTIHVSNHDLLFRMPFVGRLPTTRQYVSSNASRQQRPEFYQEIQFMSPCNVTAIQKHTRELAENEVRIASVCSLVSSGTELKIFKGDFDDAALDVSIKEMQQERMAYPLAYGYSLVGHVVECGSGVADREHLVGKLVFAFAPHSTQAVVGREAIQEVPDGVDPFDAIFMPSVETALSIVHDAHIRLGEKAVVFGQGLIGLLVTAILVQQHQQLSLQEDTLTTIDTIPTRLAASVSLGASQALFPSDAGEAGPFDVAIEVSGNPKALQAAIDNTRDNGRVVIASWYGSRTVDLKLGIEFHRSHKTLITSQVSELPPVLSGTWTKQRRFALAWELLRQIQPSRLLITKTASLSDAQEVYDSLDKGQEIAVAFDFQK
ncbi:hypothetical protein ACA910_022022 [Epithemia clementina (nom. ined.)]